MAILKNTMMNEVVSRFLVLDNVEPSMKKNVLLYTTIVLFLFTGQALHAQDSLLYGAGCGYGHTAKPSLWFLHGHAESGLFVNRYGQRNAYTGGILDTDSGNTILLNNVWQSDLQLNQAYLYGGKKLDTEHGFDIGGQVDFMYGTDGKFAQSAGLETGNGHGDWINGDYYTAIPQAYLEMGYKNVSVKAGKFYSPLGYESVLSTERFFYSTSYSYTTAPNTHSGVVLNWDATEKLSLFGGWTNGGDQFFDTSKDNAFLGGITYQFKPNTSVSYALLAGKNDQFANDTAYFSHTLLVTHKLGKKWDYVFEWTLYNNDNQDMKNEMGGINQELFYRWNPCWAFGGRVEWARNQTEDKQFQSTAKENGYAFTIGTNWTPRKWLLIRPEIRYDRFEHETFFDGGNKKGQFSGGGSIVMKF